jgi:flagellar protein FlbT
MTGLVIKLRPHEKMLVNGVVLQNGDRAAQIRVRSSGVSILRMRDALHPEDATTPMRRIYYVAQLAVAGEVKSEAATREILEGLEMIRRDLRGEDQAFVDAANKAARDGKFFVVMRAMKKLFPVEDRRAGRDAASRAPSLDIDPEAGERSG